MKRILPVVMGLTLLAACSDKPAGSGPNNPAARYGDTMVNSYQQGKQAGVEGNLDAVKKALDAYHAANEKYPQTLDEIKPMIGSDLDMSKYDYDPRTGNVALRAH